jgi:hypothetical protein
MGNKRNRSGNSRPVTDTIGRYQSWGGGVPKTPWEIGNQSPASTLHGGIYLPDHAELSAPIPFRTMTMHLR